MIILPRELFSDQPSNGLPPEKQTSPESTSPQQPPAPEQQSNIFARERPPAALNNGALSANGENAEGLPSVTELEQTLTRLVRRVAALIQVEKCVFLLYDRERDLLVARTPTLGLTNEQIKQLKTLRLAPTEGLSGEVFTSGEQRLVPDAKRSIIDPAWVTKLEIRNVLAHPLVIEHHDEHRRVTNREIVGVLHVINKRDGGDFTPDDQRLISVMARQIAAVITNAQLYLRLTEEKEHLQATLQSLMAGVVMVESNGDISLINPAARHIFGLSSTKAMGDKYSEAIPNEEVVEMLRVAVEDGEESEIELEMVPRGASEPRIFQGQTAFVRSEDGRNIVIGVVAIFNDITEIRNVERMKTAFVSTVSHELRTPLTSIKGFISTLLQDTDGYYDEATRLEFYGIIDSECDRLQRLIEDLLNVSRIESGRALQMNWGVFEPLPIVEKVIHAQGSYTDRHKFILNVAEDRVLVPLLGDSDKFDQILTNLLSNAVKYSPSGGDITVSLSTDDDNFYLSVRDSGIGIPSNKIARIFEKFERVDDRDTRQAGGTGIGLFLVKHLVERHEGTIHVESELGKGSDFLVELPLRPAQADVELQQLNDAANGRFGAP